MDRRVRYWLYRLVSVVPDHLRQSLVRLFRPSYTLGAMCVVERADGGILLVRHSYRRGWGLPGGFVDRSESPAAAAQREVEEEVGLVVGIESNPVIVVDPRRQAVDFVFRTSYDGMTPPPTSPEVVESGWFAPDRLPDLQTEVEVALGAIASAEASGTIVLVVDPAR